MALRTELLGLLAEAKANPEDRTFRLVLADWLEEHDEPERAEFVRLQLVEPEDRERSHEVWWARRERWTAGLSRPGVGIHPQRGLLHVYGQADRVLAEPYLVQPVCEAEAWVESLELQMVTLDDLNRWAGSSHFTQLVSLTLRGGHRSSDIVVPVEQWGRSRGDWSVLAKLPTLAGLSLLDIQHDDFGAEAMEMVASAAPGLLRSLRLRGTNLGDAGLACLRGMPQLPCLRELDLSQCRFGPEGFGSLAEWPGLATVERLEIGFNYPGLAGATALSRSPYRGALKMLQLRNEVLSGEMPRSGHFLNDAGLEALLDGESYTQLETLELSSQRLGPRSAEILSTKALPNLTHLDLSFNVLGDVGVRELLRAPWLNQLRELNLRFNQIGAEGAEALLAEAALERLTFLELWANEAIPVAVRERLRDRFGDRLFLQI
jgi:uncharacterized protein (TIGR02996 family)